MSHEYVDQNRAGDHICYYSDLAKIHSHFPDFRITRPLHKIFEEIAAAWTARPATV